MLQAELASSLVSDIYDAVIDPSLWRNVLEKSMRFVGGSAASLFSKDATSNTIEICYDYGIGTDYQQLYFDKYASLDPLPTGQYFVEIGALAAAADLMPYAEFLETRIYKEWIRPQSLVDCVMCALDKSATSFAMLAVFRHERDGVVDAETRRRMQFIVPHIRRAILISRAIELKTAEAATFAETLDGLTAGMFLLDRDFHVVHANLVGHEILASGGFLRFMGGRLVASDPESNQLLRTAIAAAGNGDAELGTKGVAIPLTARDGEHYVAQLLPLTSGARRQAGAKYAAVAALFVHKAALNISAPPEIIAKLYKLTPSELRVLLAIVQVGGISETAESLGIAAATVKTHLHHLFAKTDTSCQADLVKLVAGFASPLNR